jgi:uncharacterized protein (TIGR03435 family)
MEMARMTGLWNLARAGDALRLAAPMLANHLWQSTAFAAIAAGLALALKKNQARARYWIWMAASVKLLLPFALLAGVASHFVKPRAAAAPAQAAMVVEVESFSEPFREPVQAAPVRVQQKVVDPTHRDETAMNGAPQVATAVRPQSRPFGKLRVESGAPGFVARVVASIPLLCVAVWVAGFVAVLAVWGARWRRVALAMSAATVLREGREVGVLRRTESAAGLKRPIEVRASAGAIEPGVFGILRPVLAWPAGISERLDDAHLEAVMAHEVCHVRRRDNLTAALHMLVEAVFWFHPMVWWVGARLVEERERACDEQVLLLCGQPQAYAESILKVCEFCVQTPLECMSGVTGADLKKRVVEIMTERVANKLTLGKKVLLIGAAVLVAVVPIVLGQAQATRRMMLAAMDSTPKPLRQAAHAMLALEESPFTGEIAQVNVPILTHNMDSAERPSLDGTEVRELLTRQKAELEYQDLHAKQDRPNYLLVAQEPGAGQPAPPPQVFHFPQAELSSRGKKSDGPGIIDLPQAGFAAEITLAMHGTSDWLERVQVISRSLQNIASVRMGWAYVLPNGTLEYHQSDDQKVQGGAATNNNFQLGSQGAAVRTDVKDFIAFVEQVTLKDGTVVNADHDKIAATYRDISEGKTVAQSKAVVDPNSTAAQQAGKGPQLTPGLKPISFDVVSFRRTEREGPTRVDLPVEGDYIAYHGAPIDRLILFAHIARKGYVAIANEPEWAKNDLYEFTAKVAPEDVAEWKQMTLTDKRAMVANLLADVLKLKVHQDTEPHPVYDLVVTKDGPKLTEYRPGDTVKAPGGRVLTGKVLSWFDPFTLVCQDTTMAELVNSLSGPNRAGRIVVDKTGLNGAYNFTVPIPYAPIPQQYMDMADTPSTYEGLKQLGLQMVKSMGVTDTIVVDHVERPAEN